MSRLKTTINGAKRVFEQFALGGALSPDKKEIGIVLPWSATGTGKNRNIAAALTTYAEASNQATWEEADNVTQITILAVGAAAVYNHDDKALVIYDAPNAAAALAAFADGGGAALDVEYEVIDVATPTERTFTDFLTNICIVPLADTTRFVITAN